MLNMGTRGLHTAPQGGDHRSPEPRCLPLDRGMCRAKRGVDVELYQIYATLSTSQSPSVTAPLITGEPF